ncbi:hypothetical protein HOP50_11g62290 [Chloropicon primus]|uniref:G-protein coupled receptors family 3 profile domain-containing protein n=1 Tax=Chloropicon primus TaxID=1764295 RepID=A0A5B8MSQ6_9CHLO|nr:hypothetical protein A3770_11p62070 [Chloropicon primus]UPR02902.1 hypothetical protein HOP50_11g62290 [Chloropicon primus]|eukprot:QDZ23689.1 hypothetical protein A3770_11p62070 [Chloropicon primus]
MAVSVRILAAFSCVVVLQSLVPLVRASTAVHGYGKSLYFPFGGMSAAGFRDLLQDGDFTDGMTVDYWVKTYGGSTIQHMSRFCHFSFITATDKNYLQMFHMEYSSNDDAMRTGTEASQGTADLRYFHRLSEPSSLKSVPDTLEWHRITITVDSTSLLVYVNGTKFYTASYDAKPLEFNAASQGYFTLGMYTFNAGETIKSSNFYGQFDELCMYNKVVSEADIGANWQKLLISTNDASLKVRHTFEESTLRSGGPSGSFLENQGSGGAFYDLILGGFKDGDTFTDTNEEKTFTGVKPLLVVSSAPLEGVGTANEFDLVKNGGADYQLNVAVSGYDGTTPLVTDIELPYDIEVTVGPSGLMTDPDGVDVTAGGSAKTRNYKYTAPAIGGGAQPTSDEVTFHPVADNTVSYKMKILIAGEMKISEDLPSKVFTMTPIEDKPFTMNLGCHNTLGLDCSVKVLKDNEDCLYATKYFTNQNLDFNVGSKAVEGGVLPEPGYAICKLALDRSGEVPGAVKFELLDSLATTLEITGTYSIFALDDVPICSSKTVNLEEDQAHEKISLDVLDPETDMYTMVITKLPQKGKLFLENSDGSVGAEIIKPFTPYSLQEPIYQYAYNVTQVSSFWGNGKSVSYHPIQALGPPSVDSFGDTPLAWSPLWKAGTEGSLTEFSDSIISFKHDPIAYFAENGAYEYLEVNYTQPLYVMGVEIGENRGMGAVNQVRTWNEGAKKYYKLWEGTASNDIQKHHSKFQQFRKFGPTVCQPPFKSNTIRVELDTAAVPDWNEIDYVQMFGSTQLPDGALEYPSKSVYYLPDKDAYGDDAFEFAAYDCPYDRYRRSDNAKITLKIQQVNDPPILKSNQATAKEGVMTLLSDLGFLLNQDDDEVNMKIVSFSGPLELYDGTARVSALPYTGKLSTLKVKVTNCLDGQIQFTTKDTGGTPESDLETVDIAGECFARPAACTASNWNIVLSQCDDNNERKGTYSWKNPLFGNPQLPSDCCVAGQRSGANGSACVEGSALPSDFTFQCEYIVADSAVAIAMMTILLLVMLVLFVLMVIYSAKAQEKAIRRSQPVFVIIACAGGVIGLLTPFWLIGKPTDSTCTLTPLCVFLGVSVMYTAFLTKMIRIDSIFNNQAMKKVILTTNKMLVIFFKLLGLAVTMLIVHLAVAPPEAQTEVRIVNGESVVKEVCKDNTGNITFLLTVFVHAVLIIYSAYIAYKIKDVQDDFQESKSIFFGLYNSTIVCIVILPVVLALDVEITVRFILITLASVVAFGGTCIGITGSKAFYAVGSVVPSMNNTNNVNNTATDILNSTLQGSKRNTSMINSERSTSKVSPIISPKITPPPTSDKS